MNEEAQALLDKYTAQMQAVMESFRIEATALAWKIAADLVAKTLPERVAVGTLSYNGKKTKMVMAATKTVPYTPKYHDRVIKGSGKITPKRADQYTDLLVGKRHGTWARRGSTKVTYTCEGWKGVPNGAKPTVFLMKNKKTGKTIGVKFDSIVRDWTFVDAGHDEMLRQAA